MLGVVHTLLTNRRTARRQLPNWSEVPDANPTGEWLNAGVIYDLKFLADKSQLPTKEAATFTPYIEDYIMPIKRPALKPYPNF
jgi:hypothetical protein